MEGIPAGTARCHGCVVCYYLITELLDNEVEAYGVLVEFLGEVVRIPAITLSRRRIELLLERLKRGAVTPVAVWDVVEDWLLDFSCNFA